jgi:hypothetical protein
MVGMSGAKEFERLYMGEFALDPKRKVAHELIACYEYLTERYDRSVCTGGMRGGFVMPRSPYEMNLVQRHDWKRNKQLMKVAERLEVAHELADLRINHRSSYDENRRIAEESGLLTHFEEA